ncbi:hypothetical protein GCM10027575_58440 [Phytohabitans suffuscus]
MYPSTVLALPMASVWHARSAFDRGPPVPAGLKIDRFRHVGLNSKERSVQTYMAEAPSCV